MHNNYNWSQAKHKCCKVQLSHPRKMLSRDHNYYVLSDTSKYHERTKVQMSEYSIFWRVWGHSMQQLTWIGSWWPVHRTPGSGRSKPLLLPTTSPTVGTRRCTETLQWRESLHHHDVTDNHAVNSDLSCRRRGTIGSSRIVRHPKVSHSDTGRNLAPTPTHTHTHTPMTRWD